MKSLIAIFAVLAGLVSFAIAEIGIRADDPVLGYAALGKYALFTVSTPMPIHGLSCSQYHWRQ